MYSCHCHNVLSPVEIVFTVLLGAIFSYKHFNTLGNVIFINLLLIYPILLSRLQQFFCSVAFQHHYSTSHMPLMPCSLVYFTLSYFITLVSLVLFFLFLIHPSLKKMSSPGFVMYNFIAIIYLKCSLKQGCSASLKDHVDSHSVLRH